MLYLLKRCIFPNIHFFKNYYYSNRYNDDTIGRLLILEPCFFSMRAMFLKMDDNDVNKFNPIFLSQLLCHD